MKIAEILKANSKCSKYYQAIVIWANINLFIYSRKQLQSREEVVIAL